MADQDYDGMGGWYDKHTGEYLSDDQTKAMMKKDTKAKTPTYRHAQKEAMQRGDSDTYFMRKVGKKRSKSRSPKSKSKKRSYSSGKR